MFLIVQTFVVTVEMYADPSPYYYDVDEYENDLKYTALNPQCILAFLAELKNSKSGGQILCCLPNEQILLCN